MICLNNNKKKIIEFSLRVVDSFSVTKVGTLGWIILFMYVLCYKIQMLHTYDGFLSVHYN